MRIKIIENCIFASIALIGIALVYTQTIQGGHYYSQSVNNRIRVVSIEGPRGKIFDRNGLVLAENKLIYNLGVIAQDVDDSQSLFNFLGSVLKKSPEALKKQFIRKRKTPFSSVILAQDVDQKVIFPIEENRFRYPGFVLEESYERNYPYGKTDAHVIGYVGKMDEHEASVLESYGYNSFSVIGKLGVEKTYDSVLRGEPGGRQIEINNRGQEVRLLGLKKPVVGQDIELSIDQRIQNVAEELLDSRPGAIVLMDLNNGDILSMVSTPSFDPNVFFDKERQDQMMAYIRDPKALFLNRAVTGRYPPGSVFKIPVALAAVDLKKITPDVSFNCPGFYMLGNAKFGCAHVHDSEDLNQAIAHSCNVYFYHIGQLITARIIQQYAKAFGLGRVTGIDLPFEASGQVLGGSRPGHPWYTGNTLNLSIGQGETLSTPLQLTVLMAAVANDGVIFRPRIVQAVDHKKLPDVDIRHLPIVRLKDSTWRLIQKGLRAVVTDPEGTAHILEQLPNMTVYGKTGTAQAGANKANHAWFAGYLRSPKNNIAFCVFLEHGGSSSLAVELTNELLTRIQAQGIV